MWWLNLIIQSIINTYFANYPTKYIFDRESLSFTPCHHQMTQKNEATILAKRVQEKKEWKKNK